MASDKKDVKEDLRVLYHGEALCAKSEKCRNRAYFLSCGLASCGVHSKSDPHRQELPENPNKEKIEQLRLTSMAEAALVVSFRLAAIGVVLRFAGWV